MTIVTNHKAELFRDLNTRGQFLLPNAWDAASARIFEKAGFPAIGTTSAGIAYGRGFSDGQQISREAMVQEISSIVRAVKIPVSADIESGYGPSPEDVAGTVRAVIEAGAVGINLEDNTHGGVRPLFDIPAQSKRIAAARFEGMRSGIALAVNARTDVFLLGLGESESERIRLTIERGQAYLAAGADLVFVPMALELRIVQELSRAFEGRLNLLAVPGAPAANALFQAGAQRVSLGQTAMLASLGAIKSIAQELQDNGTWTSIERNFFGFAEAEALFHHD